MMRSGAGQFAVVPAVLAASATLALGSCSQYRVTREVVVKFRTNATQEQHDAARSACTGVVARSTPVPKSTSTLPAARLNDVRFRVDAANDGELAQLYDCLRRQPGVLGVTLPTK